MEVGTHSPWVSRLLEETGHEVLVANPRRLKLIYGETDKSDGLDAQHLARVGRMDPKLLSAVQHRGAEAQADLALLRSRDALVRTRAQLVNHVRGSVKSVGARLPKCSTPSFARKAAPHLPERLRPALEPVLAAIVDLSDKIRAYDREIERLGNEQYPEVQKLRAVPGVGALTGLAYVLTLEEPERFQTSRSVGPYLGLRPKKRQSGDSDPSLRITKAGDNTLRRLLVGSAHYILGPFGPDCDLRRWGLSLAARGGPHAKKKAAVAVARKLSGLLHHLWLTGERYEPFYTSSVQDAA
jgi:transposase